VPWVGHPIEGVQQGPSPLLQLTAIGPVLAPVFVGLASLAHGAWPQARGMILGGLSVLVGVIGTSRWSAG